MGKLTMKMVNDHLRCINQLCYEGEKVIDSENFRDLTYVVKDNHLILLSRSSGEFCIKIDVVKDLCKEIKEIAEVWGDVKTKKCLL